MDSVTRNLKELSHHNCLHRKPNRVDIFKASLKTISKEYCQESSICGLKQLVNCNTSYIERIIIVIMLCIGLVCSISLVWITFNKYYTAPLVTTQMPDGVSVSRIVFPAVGICTNNRISKRAVTQLAKQLLKEERNNKYNENEMLALLFGLGQLYNSHTADLNYVRLLELHHALGEYDVREIMRNITPRCEDILIRCAWNTEYTNCLKLFDFRLTMNGYCCTFNYLRFSDVFIENDSSVKNLVNTYTYGNKSFFDFDQGLKVVLRLNESDDFYYNVPLQGAQLQFSNAYDFPDAPSGSFNMQIISPTVQMTVTVTARLIIASRDIQHVPISIRKCRFYDETSYLSFYTYSDCMLKCRMLFLLNRCNCIPFNMPKLANIRTCDVKDVMCLRRHYAQSISVRPQVDRIPPELELGEVNGGIDCPMCYPACSNIVYGFDFNDVIIYPEFLNSVPDRDRDDWLQGANFNGTSIVHVKYARDTADRYVQNVIMKWFDLISNIGSTCGFITGFSFVSVLEFIYFFTVKLVREFNRRRCRVNHVKDTMNNDINEARIPKHLKPVPKYGQIYWNEITAPVRYAQNSEFFY